MCFHVLHVHVHEGYLLWLSEGLSLIKNLLQIRVSFRFGVKLGLRIRVTVRIRVSATLNLTSEGAKSSLKSSR